MIQSKLIDFKDLLSNDHDLLVTVGDKNETFSFEVNEKHVLHLFLTETDPEVYTLKQVC